MRLRDSNEPGFFDPYKKAAVRKLHQAFGGKWAERIVAIGQFIELVLIGFNGNRCPVRATALAYTTLLALIPMLALVASVSTSILKSQGKERINEAVQTLVTQIIPKLTEEQTNQNDVASRPPVNPGVPAAGPAGTNAPAQTHGNTNRFQISAEAKLVAAQTISTNQAQIVNIINDSLQNIESGSLGVMGMIGLVMVAIMLFSTIESTFNDIWGVPKGRSWVSRIVQYWATVTLGPLIPFAVISLNIGSQLPDMTNMTENLPILNSMLNWAVDFLTLQIVPLLILSFGFSFFYQLMPNTKVQWRAAFIGGLTAGVLWQLNNKLNVFFASKVITFAKIYGGFAMIPVFLVALYLSWLILLFGAQVAYAYQNRAAYLKEKEAQRINFLGREYLAVRIMTLLAQRFDDPQGKAPGIIEIANLLSVSTRLVDDIVKMMASGRLVIETSPPDPGFTLTRPLEKITCHDILMAMRTANGEVTETGQDAIKPVVDEVFQEVLAAEKSAAGKITLRQLLDRTAAT